MAVKSLQNEVVFNFKVIFDVDVTFTFEVVFIFEAVFFRSVLLPSSANPKLHPCWLAKIAL